MPDPRPLTPVFRFPVDIDLPGVSSYNNHCEEILKVIFEE